MLHRGYPRLHLHIPRVALMVGQWSFIALVINRLIRRDFGIHLVLLLQNFLN